MNKSKSTLLYFILAAGIIVLVNILANRFYLRLDFTEDKRYTLSNTTKDLLENLEDPVTVTAFFSEGLPPNIDVVRRRFKELLTEYAARSGGKVVYEFINPNKDEESEQQAAQNGISPVMINVREKDQAVQKKAFLGAVIRYGEEDEVIPFVQPGSAMEYTLSSSIKKLTVDEKNLIGIVQGHGEPSVSSLQQAVEAINVLNEAEAVHLTDSTYLPKYKALIIMAPTDSIPAEHLLMLDDYLAGGGNIIAGVNRVDGDLNQGMGLEVTTGLETWLAGKGIEVENSFIIDANCGAVSVVQQQGMFSFTSQVEFPYLPVFNTFNEHPVTEGLETVVMQFASPVSFTGDTTLNFTPLLFSSETSGTRSLPLWFDIEHKWGSADFPLENIVAAAVLEGKISGTNDAKLVVFGDGDFPVNQGQQQISPDNVNLLVNAVDWLSDDTGLIELRTRGVTSRMLKQIEDCKKNFLKWLNLTLPVLLIIIYGLYRIQKNRVIREKRRSEGYNR